jgi:hypothetical protein
VTNGCVTTPRRTRTVASAITGRVGLVRALLLFTPALFRLVAADTYDHRRDSVHRGLSAFGCISSSGRPPPVVTRTSAICSLGIEDAPETSAAPLGVAPQVAACSRVPSVETTHATNRSSPASPASPASRSETAVPHGRASSSPWPLEPAPATATNGTPGWANGSATSTPTAVATSSTAAAAAVLLVATAVGVLVADPFAQPGVPFVAVAGAGSSGHGELEARPWGTAVSLRLAGLAGLAGDDRFVAWVVSTEGTREQAATWGATPNGAAEVSGASSIPSEQIALVRVTTGGGRPLLEMHPNADRPR